MKFKVNTKKRNTDLCYVKRFAFIPKRIGDVIVWLESYYSLIKRDHGDGWLTLRNYTKEEYRQSHIC